MFACQFGVAANGILANFQQASRFPHADSFVDVFDDGNDFCFWQACVEQDGASPFGKAFVASAAPQQSGVVGTVGIANADIFRAANTEL